MRTEERNNLLNLMIPLMELEYQRKLEHMTRTEKMHAPTVRQYTEHLLSNFAHLCDEDIKMEFIRNYKYSWIYVIATGKDCDNAPARFMLHKYADIDKAIAAVAEHNEDSDGVLHVVVNYEMARDYCEQHEKEFNPTLI